MFKGWIINKKKGSLSNILPDNIWVTDRPFIEKDPTVPQHVKSISTQDIQDWVDGFNNNIISGSVTGDQNKILTLTRRNGQTLSIPFNDLQGLSTDDVINTLNFNTSTGVMTAVTSEGVQITTNLDGRYALLGHTHSEYASVNHTHNYDNYQFWNLRTNGIQRITITSGGIADFVESDNIAITYGAGGQVIIKKRNKEVVSVTGSSPTVPTGYNTKWLKLTGTDPTLTISGTFAKDDEIEGSFVGTGRLTVVGSGITLIYSDEFHQNKYPKGGVFGLKFISATEAMLFGKQIPVGL